MGILANIIAFHTVKKWYDYCPTDKKYPPYEELDIVWLLYSILLCLPSALFAQDVKGDQEFSASYGITSGTDIINRFSTPYSRPNLDRGSFNVASSKTGNIFVTYRYFFNPKLDLGITLGTESLTFSHYQNTPPPAPTPMTGTYNVNITTLAIELKPIYYNGRIIQLYGLVGLGARYYTQKEVGQGSAPLQNPTTPTGIFVNSQMTPIGVRAGKRLSGFVELGIGYKGLVNAGVSYKVNGKRAATTEIKKVPLLD